MSFTGSSQNRTPGSSPSKSDCCAQREPVIVVPRPTFGTGYARYPRPRRKALPPSVSPSAVSNVVSLLPPSPVKDFERRPSLSSREAKTALSTLPHPHTVNEDNQSVVEHNSSRSLRICNPSETEVDGSSSEAGEQMNAGSKLDSANCYQPSETDSDGIHDAENPWQDQEATSPEEAEVLSVLEAMSAARSPSHQINGGHGLPLGVHHRHRSEPVALVPTTGRPTVQGLAAAFDNSRPPSSLGHRTERNSKPLSASPSRPDLKHTSHVTSPGVCPEHSGNLTPSRNDQHSTFHPEVVSSNRSVSPFSTKSPKRALHSPQSSFLASPMDLGSSIFSGPPLSSGNDSVSSGSYFDGARRPILPGRMLTDYTTATTIYPSDDEYDLVIEPEAKADRLHTSSTVHSPIRLSARESSPRSRPVSGARHLISLFEQREAASNGETLRSHDPGTRASSSCYTATVRPRLLRACDLLGVGSGLTYNSQSADENDPQTVPGHVSVTPRAGSPLPTGLVRPSSSASVQQRTEPEERQQEHSKLHVLERFAAAAAVFPQEHLVTRSEIVQRKTSLPLTDLVPRASSAEDLAASLRESKEFPHITSAKEGTVASRKRSKEEGRRSTSPERALSMIRTDQPPLQAGNLWYYDVHDTHAGPHWVIAQAILFPGALALSWLPPFGGRESVVFELEKCCSVHSLPSESARTTEQGDHSPRKSSTQIKPFQFVFEDGVERVGVETIRERAQWVARARDALPDGHIDVTTSLPGSPSKTSLRKATSTAGQSPDPQLDRTSGVWRSAEESTQTGSRAEKRLPSSAPTLPPKDAVASEGVTYTQVVKKGQPVHTESQAPGAASVRASFGEVTHSLYSALTGSESRPATVSQPPVAFRSATSLHPPPDEDDSATILSASPRSFAMLQFPGGDDIYPGDSASQCMPASDAATRIELPEILRSLRKASPSPPKRGGSVLPLSAVDPINTSTADPTREEYSTANVHAALPTVFEESSSRLDSGRSHREVAKTASAQQQTLLMAKDQRSSTEMSSAKAPSVSTTKAKSKGISTKGSEAHEVNQLLSRLEQQSRDAQEDNENHRAVSSVGKAASPSSTRNAAAPATTIPGSANPDMNEAHLPKIHGKVDELLKLVTKIYTRQKRGPKPGANEELLFRIAADIRQLKQHVDEQTTSRAGARSQQAVGRERPGSGMASSAVASHFVSAHCSGLAKQRSPEKHPSQARGAQQSGIGSINPQQHPESQTTWTQRTVNSPSGPRTNVSHASRAEERGRGFQNTPWSRNASPVRFGANNVQHHAASSQNKPPEPSPNVVSQHRMRPSYQPVSMVEQGNLPMPMPQPETTLTRPQGSVLAHMPMAMPIPEHHADQDQVGANASYYNEVRTAPQPHDLSQPAQTVDPAGPQAAIAALGQGAGLIAELARVLEEHKSQATERERQQEQQTDISRYLNELNKWLESDVAGRNNDFKSLQDSLQNLRTDLTGFKDVVAARLFEQQSRLAEAAASRLPGELPLKGVAETVVSYAAAAKGGEQKLELKDGTSEIQPEPAPAEVETDHHGKLDDLLHTARDEYRRHVDAFHRTGRPLSPTHGTAELAEHHIKNIFEAAVSHDHKSLRKALKDAALAGAGTVAVKLVEEHVLKKKEELQQETQASHAGEVTAAAAPPKKTTVEDGQDELPDLTTKPVGGDPETAADFTSTAVRKSSSSSSSSTSSSTTKHSIKDNVTTPAKPVVTSNVASPPAPAPVPAPAVSSAAEQAAQQAMLQAAQAAQAAQAMQAAQTASAAALTSLLQEVMGQIKKQHDEGLKWREEMAAKEAARAEADKAWQEESAKMAERQAAGIIGAIAQHVSNERKAREEKEAARAKELDPKTAIEALVKALNDTRIEEANKRLQTDRGVAELAAGVVQNTERQHERLLSALTALSRDVVCTSVDNHLQQFKGAMANSFAGSAQAMADAWTAHANHVASMPRATLGAPPPGHIVVVHQQAPPPPKPAEQPKPAATPKPAPAPAPPQPPPPRPLGPYGMAAR